jgi:iron complex outermembrane recepter protein
MNIKTLAKGIAVATAAFSVGIPVTASAAQLEEIVVTAQKRAQSMNDIGVAVTAFSGAQMKELGMVTAKDVAAQTPGLYVTDAGAGGIPVYTVRGVGFDDLSINSNGTVGLYVDEVAFAYPAMSRGLHFDVERIEVLKGPQGDLYGRNNTGGAINFVSNAPTEEFEAGVALDYGRYAYKKIGAFVSGGVSDNINARFAVESIQQGEGWQVNEANGEKLGEIDSTAGRLLLDWAASDDVGVLLNLHATKDDSDNPVPQTFTSSPSYSPSAYPSWDDLAPLLPYLPWTSEPVTVNDRDDPNAALWTPGTKPGRDVESWGVSVTVNWDFSHVTLTSISAYDQYERQETGDWDGLLDRRSDNAFDSEIDGWSQELRLSSNSDNDLSWIAGIYLAEDTVKEDMLFGFGNASNSFSADNANTRYKQETEIRAIYGHAEWQFAENWRLTLGARYTEEDREIDICTYDTDGSLAYLYSGVFPSLGYPGLAVDDGTVDGRVFEQGDCVVLGDVSGISSAPAGDLYGGLASYYLYDVSNYQNSLKTDKFTGKFGIDFMPDEDWLIYASIGTGFKSGGYNGQPTNAQSTLAPYSEENLTAYEIGFKGTMLDGSMQLNGAIFQYDYEDKQVADATPDPVFGFLTFLKNVPEAEVEGAEMEVIWQPTDRLSLRASATYLDATVTKFDNGFNFLTFEENLDFSGKKLPNAAKLSWNGLASYEWHLTGDLFVRATADVMHTDDYFSYLSNNPTDQVDGYTLYNARISIGAQDGSWDAALWGKNLTDEYYYTSNTAGNDTIGRYTGQGATYGLSLSYSFN